VKYKHCPYLTNCGEGRGDLVGESGSVAADETTTASAEWLER